jgi:hypothetical protein
MEYHQDFKALMANLNVRVVISTNVYGHQETTNVDQILTFEGYEMALNLYYIFIKCKFESENTNYENLKINFEGFKITSTLQISNFLELKVSLDFFSCSVQPMTPSAIYSETFLKGLL